MNAATIKARYQTALAALQDLEAAGHEAAVAAPAPPADGGLTDVGKLVRELVIDCDRVTYQRDVAERACRELHGIRDERDGLVNQAGRLGSEVDRLNDRTTVLLAANHEAAEQVTALEARIRELMDLVDDGDREAIYDLVGLIEAQQAFSVVAFGPGERTAGVVDHIRKELLEVLADPSDVTEWIDIVTLALDGAWRAGHTPQTIAAALVAKRVKNEARTWPDWRTAPKDKAIEHVRDEGDTATISLGDGCTVVVPLGQDGRCPKCLAFRGHHVDCEGDTEAKPVCGTCNDTHVMTLDDGDRTVMCTHCPVPCRSCAVGNGVGAYCGTTPCACACHAKPVDVSHAGMPSPVVERCASCSALADRGHLSDCPVGAIVGGGA